MVEIPLFGPSGKPLDTGVITAQTARLTSPDGKAWAGALQDLSIGVQQFAKTRRKQNDAIAMMDLGTKMRDLSSLQYEFQKSQPDQEQWATNWEELTRKFNDEELAKADLSPDARISVSESFGRFAQNQSIAIQQQAGRQAEARMWAQADTITMQARKAGSVTDVRAVKPMLIEGGVPEEIAEKYVVENEMAAQDQAQQNFTSGYRVARAEAIRTNQWSEVQRLDDEALQAGIFADPVKTKEALDAEVTRGQLTTDILTVAQKQPQQAKQMLEDSSLPITDKANVRNMIDQREAELTRDEIAFISDQFVTGGIKSGADVQFQVITSPSKQAEIRAEIDRRPPTSDEVVGEMLGIRSQISDFDRSAFNAGNPEAMKQYVSINARIAKLPASQREDVNSLWDKARQGQMSVKDEYVTGASKILNELFQAEEDKFFDTNNRGHKTLKPAKRQEYIDFQLRITKMEQDLQRLIPDDADPKKASEIINQVVTGQAAEIRKSSYSPAPASGFQPVPAKGKEPTMPGFNFSYPSAALFPIQ